MLTNLLALPRASETRSESTEHVARPAIRLRWKEPLTSPASRAAAAPRRRGAVQRLLLALRGSGSASDAAVAAAELARCHRAPVDVVSVYEPRVPYPYASEQRITEAEPHDQPALEAQRAGVQRELGALAERYAPAAAWDVTVEVGQAAARIAHAARDAGADLIVLGRGRQTRDEPWLLDRTALKVAIVSTVPILSVVRGGRLPGRLMLAVGLDELTVHVASAARQIFPNPSAVELVHVRLDDRTSDAERQAQFDRIALILGYPAERITRTVLTGEPVGALLEHAASTAPDCIATGLHGVTVAERSLARNLSLHLLDRAPYNVLVVPK